MAKKRTETAPPPAAPPDPPPPKEDGPTKIDPLPPGGGAVIPDGEAPKRRGRPPGVKNGEGGAAKKRAKPILKLEDVKADLAATGFQILKMAKGTKFQDAALKLDWCQLRQVQDGEKQGVVVLPSDRVEMAIDMMGPWLEESGSLDLVQLGPEAKFAIGLAILTGPMILEGFKSLWTWAFHPKPARDQTVSVKSPETDKDRPHNWGMRVPCADAGCRMPEDNSGKVEHAKGCALYTPQIEPEKKGA
jgi:hypothetical protein